MRILVQDDRTHLEVLEAMAAGRSLAVTGDERRVQEVGRAVRSYEGDPALILATSGTTGAPKLAVIPWPAVQARCDIMAAAVGEEALAVVGHPSNRTACMGVHSAILAAAQRGGRVVPVDDWASVDKWGVTLIYSLFNLTPWQGAPAKGTLRYLILAGTTLREKHRAALAETTGARVVTCYGATETGPVVASDGGPIPEGLVGTAMPGAALRVTDGLVEVRTPGMAAAYVGTGPLPLHEGWYRPGDLGLLDEAGRLFVVGRTGGRAGAPT